MYRLHFGYSLVDGYFGYLHLLAIGNHVALNTGVQSIPLRDSAFNSLGYIPRSRIAALLGCYLHGIYFSILSLLSYVSFDLKHVL